MNANKNTIIKIFILVFIIGFLFLINFVFAQFSPEEIIKNKDLIEFKAKDSENILWAAKPGIFNNLSSLISDSAYSNLKEQAVSVILLQAIKINSMQYILTAIGKDGIEFTLKIANLIISKDPSLIIKEIEKMTVDQAKNYAMDWLLQKEMKVSKGNLDISYPALAGGWEQVIFPYIIVYQPLNLEQGKVAIGIYSSETIKTPVVSPKYQWEGGINELPPFIVEITGEVEKSDQTNDIYRWIKGPEINIIFDQPAPKFEFNPLTIIEKIEAYFNKAMVVLDKIKELGKGIIESIFSFISGSDSFEASIIQPVFAPSGGTKPGLSVEASEEEIREIIKDVVQLETLPEEELEQFEEMLDDIAERIDILSQQIAGLVNVEERDEELVFVETAMNQSELASEIADKNPEEFSVENEEIKEIEENKTTITTKTSRASGSGNPPAPSYCSITEIGQASMDKVVFDGIAWMGTVNSSNDEWIKLKNISSEQIDLSSWQILDKDKQIKIILSGKINDFYLLERTNDDSLPGTVADFIYTGALNDTDEALYLFDNNCVLQDKIIADPDWPGGDKENKTPMKRNQDLTWYIIDTEEDVGAGSDDVGAGLPSPEIEGGETPPLQPESEPEEFQQIIINEIAWMGTKASSTDEWIELYNPNSEPIDLLDWELRFYPLGAIEPRINIFSSTIETTTPSIDGLSYFLLERTDDNTVSDIKADYIFTGALNDEGGILELRDNNDNLIDKIDCSNGQWRAGDKDKKISMERFGNDEWTDNNLIIYQGKDAENNQIWATPRAQNSINPPTEIYQQLPFDEFDEITLAIESSPYIVKTNLEVPEGKILKIEPGVVLKFYDFYHGILVSGTLKAIGTEDQKIIFTSDKEDPYPGSWNKIHFSPTSIDSELTNVIIEYAGAEAGLVVRSGIKVDQSSIVLKDSLIRYNMYAGISLNNSDSLIDNVQFIENEIWCKECHNQFGSYGIEIRGGAPVIKNSLFKKNTAGISINDLASPAVENNNFEENEKAVYLSSGSPYFSNNQALNNEINGIFVQQAEISRNTVWEADLPYVISLSLNVFPDVIFTIKPGAILKFYNEISGISVAGALKADNVIFTSFSDNPYPGSWNKIYFSPTSIDSELTNVIIEYAGAQAGLAIRSAIEVDQCSIALKDSLIRNNMHAGIYLTNSSSLIDNVQFLENEVYNNQYGGMGIGVSAGTPTIKNSIFKKHRYGIYVRDKGVPILENLIFGAGDEANECNIFQENQCIDPVPTP